MIKWVSLNWWWKLNSHQLYRRKLSPLITYYFKNSTLHATWCISPGHFTMRYAQYIWPSVNKIPSKSPTLGMGGPSQWQTAAMRKIKGVNLPLYHFKVFMGFKKNIPFYSSHRWIKITPKNQGIFIVLPSSMSLHSYTTWQRFAIAVFNFLLKFHFLLGFHWCHSNGQTASSKEIKATASQRVEKMSHRLVCTKNKAGIECRLTTRTCFPAWPVHWNPWDISHTRPRAQVSMNTTLTCLLKKAVRGSEEVMSEQLKIHARPKSRLILARYWYCFKEGKKLHAGGFSLLCMSCHIWNCLWTK